MFGWLSLPDPGSGPTVGMPHPGPAVAGEDPLDGPGDSGARVLDRCEQCGVAVERAQGEVDLEAELEAITRDTADAVRRVAAPNRASLQATLGGEGWAAIDERAGRLLLTPASLRLLAVRTGRAPARLRCTRFGRNQRWMWQTLVNGLTLHPNFAREALAGRLRPRTGRGPLAFAVDCVVTTLAAPLVALVSVPLEVLASLARRGGELVAELPPASPVPGSPVTS